MTDNVRNLVQPSIIGLATGIVAAHYGDEVRTRFRYNLSESQDMRLGQAFMNSIPIDDYQILTGTKADPFYDESNSPSVIASAIDFIREQRENPENPENPKG